MTFSKLTRPYAMKDLLVKDMSVVVPPQREPEAVEEGTGEDHQRAIARKVRGLLYWSVPC